MAPSTQYSTCQSDSDSPSPNVAVTLSAVRGDGGEGAGAVSDQPLAGGATEDVHFGVSTVLRSALSPLYTSIGLFAAPTGG